MIHLPVSEGRARGSTGPPVGVCGACRGGPTHAVARCALRTSQRYVHYCEFVIIMIIITASILIILIII